MRKLLRTRTVVRMFFEDLYARLNGGKYRNRDAAEMKWFQLTVDRKMPKHLNYDETRVTHNIQKKEIKMSSLSGVIRTIRYK